MAIVRDTGIATVVVPSFFLRGLDEGVLARALVLTSAGEGNRFVSSINKLRGYWEAWWWTWSLPSVACDKCDGSRYWADCNTTDS
jgi:hypothetical protein